MGIWYRTFVVAITSLILGLCLYSVTVASEQVVVPADKLYVTCKGDNTIQVFNVSTGAVDRLVQAGSQPYIITLNADRSRALVANYDSGTVSVIDTVNDTLVHSFDVGHGPTGVAFSLDGSRAYVSNAFSFCISIYDIGTGKRIVTVSATQPAGIVAGNDGFVYAVDPGSNSLLVIDPAAGLPNASIPSGGSYNEITLIPGGTALLASTTDGNVSFFDLATRRVTGELHAGNGPYDIALIPDGRTACLTNMNGNTVTLLDLDARTVTGTIPVGKMPAGIAVSDDGHNIYVANSGANSISVINASTGKVDRTFQTGKTPYGVAYISGTALAEVPEPTGILGPDNALLNFGLIGLVLAFVAIAGALTFLHVRK